MSQLAHCSAHMHAMLICTEIIVAMRLYFHAVVVSLLTFSFVSFSDAHVAHLINIPRIIHATQSNDTNIILGAAFNAVSKGWLNLLNVFLDSMLARVPNAHLVLMADTATLDVIAPRTRQLGARFHPLEMTGIAAAGVPKVFRQINIIKSRYYAYRKAMKAVHQMLTSIGGAGMGSTAADSSYVCPDWSAAPLVLITDTRDVAFQHDPFTSARRFLRETAIDSPSTPTLCSPPPLLVAAEPSIYRM